MALTPARVYHRMWHSLPFRQSTWGKVMKPTHADRGHIPFRVLANYFSISLLALALGVAISACGPSEVGESSAAASDTTQPTSGGTGGDTTPPGILSLLPASGSRIGGTRKIAVTFNESIKPSTLRLRGDLAGESDGGKFSKATFKNDTLKIAPITQWAEGDDRTLTFNVKDPKGNALGKANLTYTVDLTDPVGNVSPESGAIIGGEAPIVITFDGSMRTSLMVLQGDLIEESDGGVWSETTVPKDTLTISPLTAWTAGEARGLTIDGEDLAGNVLETLTLSYTVDTTSPVGSVSPAPGTIRSDAAIVITFDEAMDPTSETVALDADIFTSTGTVSWGDSGAGPVNDQLTISAPDSGWANDTDTGTIQVTADDLAGNTSDTGVLTYTVDTPATVSANYPSDSDTIDEDSQIVFVFSESMDAATGTVTGTLGGGTPVVTWSTTTNANDTATITPSVPWTGTESIGLDADDVAGNTTNASLTSLTASASGAGILSVTPGDGTILGTSDSVVIVYTTTMVNGSEVYDGSMGTEADAGEWGLVSDTDDQLTISPTSFWSMNPNASLIIEVEVAGSIVTVTSLTYDVQ